MLYRINLDRVEEFKKGRKVGYLATLTNYTREYMSEILTGKRNLDYERVKKVVIPICQESFLLKDRLEKEGLEEIIKYFFIEIL